MKTFEQYWEENGDYKNDRERIIAEDAWNMALEEFKKHTQGAIKIRNRIRQELVYRDGGTTLHIVLEGPLKGQKVYRDFRIHSETRGKFFDRYPGESGAKILDGEFVSIL